MNIFGKNRELEKRLTALEDENKKLRAYSALGDEEEIPETPKAEETPAEEPAPAPPADDAEPEEKAPKSGEAPVKPEEAPAEPADDEAVSRAVAKAVAPLLSQISAQRKDLDKLKSEHAEATKRVTLAIANAGFEAPVPTGDNEPKAQELTGRARVRASINSHHGAGLN